MKSIKNILSNAVASGIKEQQNSPSNNLLNEVFEKLDLAVIVLPENSNTAAVFTKNIFCAAPIIIAKNNLPNKIRALVINSGNANAGTGVASGELGITNAYKVCQLVADELEIGAEKVLPFSTGVIGQQLPMTCFENNIKTLINGLNETNLENVSKAILTTDTCTKTISKTIEFNKDVITITGMAKGSGMIRPNMATMLSFIFTDIQATQKELQQCLEIAVNQSFNRITVDGDTSTNDACSLSTTNQSNIKLSHIKDDFQKALNEICLDLALKIIEDGEGATKKIEIEVVGGATNHSPLVKIAFFASDANWGRILAAVGYSDVKNLKTENINIYLDDVCLIKNGILDKNYTEEKGNNIMQQQNIKVFVEIGKSTFKETVWTTDLSYDYIKINSEYRS
ncbi:Glutamate N-acetyltransferase / N-acetylglutamate synthase [hydrothermal vent metagenome]|uniref:Glutamate N-acetyltransferase / N-acetylglutamate synthase n=1 Tax=hydrothermal vent metagenome TaxID=652676 RepID=A0A1W1BWG4_9ZZZZ